MEIICNHCGHCFGVQAYETYAICPNCQTPLRIEETDDTIVTIIMKPKELTDLLNGVVQQKTVSSLEQRLAKLDRDWQLSQHQFEGRGVLQKPNAPLSVLLLSGGLLFLFLWVVSKFIYSGILALLLIFFGISGVVKYLEHLKAKRLYQTQRKKLEENIKWAKHNDE